MKNARFLVLALFLFFIISAGCGEESKPSASVSASETGTVSETVSSSTAISSTAATIAKPVQGQIRNVDWKAIVEVNPISKFGAVAYSDLTGDGVDDALVAEANQGSGSYLTYYVYTYKGTNLTKLFEKKAIFRGKVQLGSELGTFLETSGESTSDYANCCPKDWRYKTYKWSDITQTFEVIDDHVTPNPDAIKIH